MSRLVETRGLVLLPLLFATLVPAVVGAQITNQACISHQHVNPDPNPSNDCASVDSTVSAEADLDIVKTAEPTEVEPGALVVYRIEVENLGPSAADDVTITDDLPPEMTFVAIDDGGGACTTPAVGDSGTVSCLFAGATGPGTVLVVEITVQAPVSPAPLILDNVAITSSAVSDPVSSNDSGSTTVMVGAALLEVPSLSSAGLVVLLLALAGAGLLAMRRA